MALTQLPLYRMLLLLALLDGADTELRSPEGGHGGPINRVGLIVEAIFDNAPYGHRNGAEHSGQTTHQLNQAG